MIRCSCGNPIEVPSFRELQKLPTVGTTEPPKRKSSWHPLQGALFCVGTILLIVPLGWAGILEWRRQSLDIAEDPRIKQQLERHLTNIGNLQIDQTFDNWQMIKQQGLGRRDPPAYVKNRRDAKNLGKLALGMVGVGLFGAVLIATSLLIRPGKRRRGSPHT